MSESIIPGTQIVFSQVDIFKPPGTNLNEDTLKLKAISPNHWRGNDLEATTNCPEFSKDTHQKGLHLHSLSTFHETFVLPTCGAYDVCDQCLLNSSESKELVSEAYSAVQTELDNAVSDNTAFWKSLETLVGNFLKGNSTKEIREEVKYYLHTVPVSVLLGTRISSLERLVSKLPKYRE